MLKVGNLGKTIIFGKIQSNTVAGNVERRDRRKNRRRRKRRGRKRRSRRVY